jgi:crotonobetainyl-CoA:carnitine CoA-transferase CaiB-like acyl-CoA transferase
MIGAANQSIWERCARALDRPEWIEDPRFRSGSDRLRNRSMLEKEMDTVLMARPSAHWIAVLEKAGVPCGPVNTYKQLFEDPQIRHRELVVHVDDAELGRVSHIRTPIRMSETPVAVRTVAPKLGQHNVEVLSSLGYSDAEIRDFARERII